jgi:hypothetical protein
VTIENYEDCSNEHVRSSVSECGWPVTGSHVAVCMIHQQSGEFFVEGSVSWCINGMSASLCMEIIFNGLYFFAQKIREWVSFE